MDKYRKRTFFTILLYNSGKRYRQIPQGLVCEIRSAVLIAALKPDVELHLHRRPGLSRICAGYRAELQRLILQRHCSGILIVVTPHR